MNFRRNKQWYEIKWIYTNYLYAGVDTILFLITWSSITCTGKQNILYRRFVLWINHLNHVFETKSIQFTHLPIKEININRYNTNFLHLERPQISPLGHQCRRHFHAHCPSLMKHLFVSYYFVSLVQTYTAVSLLISLLLEFHHHCHYNPLLQGNDHFFFNRSKGFDLNLVVVSDDVANRVDNCVGNRKQYRILNRYSVTMGGQKNIRDRFFFIFIC